MALIAVGARRAVPRAAFLVLAFAGTLLGPGGDLPARGGCGAAAQTYSCPHCDVGESFGEFLKPDSPETLAGPHSDVHVLWPTTIEVVPVTSDIGGWEPPEFHQKIAKEVVKGWRSFQKKIVPALPKKHDLRRQLEQTHAGAVNDAFFHWQKRLFEAEGDLEKSLEAQPQGPVRTPPPEANASWPEMNALPEFRKLRKIVERMSRRYLIRIGMNPEVAMSLNYSLFNWAAVHRPGEFHGPHTHIGEYHVGVFYAQVGPASGKLRFGDPRGHSPPFARDFFHKPRSGDLVFFPAWLSHMATVSAPASDLPREEGDGREPLRVVISFNIGPVQGPLPCHLWWSDPTSDMRFRRRSPIDREVLGL